jgi:hypothetical protein
MTKLKKRKLKKPRDLVVLGMILTRKGGRMRDRRLRRPGDARRDPLKEDR